MISLQTDGWRRNPWQKRILIVGLILTAVTLLFPPWDYFDPDPSGRESAGYHFFLMPPAPRPAVEVFRDVRFSASCGACLKSLCRRRTVIAGIADVLVRTQRELTVLEDMEDSDAAVRTWTSATQLRVARFRIPIDF